MSYNNENRMSGKTVVVVFPSIYSLNKINNLLTNISEILKIKNQTFKRLQKDESVIVLEAKDPVIASSIINLLFGIERVAIAREVVNNFDSVLSAITDTALSLLLRGERFHVTVDGKTRNFLAKDLEVAATAALIEKAAILEAKPEPDPNHGKLIYAYLTDLHAYVCIFVDKGLGGLPYNSHGEKILCCVYDELSALSCLQAIKMGFEVKILVCYRTESELLKLSKMINRILPRIVQARIVLDICKITCSSNLLTMITAITQVMISVASKGKIKRVALAISPMIFPVSFLEFNLHLIFQSKLVPWIPLSGIDIGLLENAKEIGLEKYVSKLYELCRKRLSPKSMSMSEASKCASETLKTIKRRSITVGPQNVHDIIDSLKSNH